MDRVFNINNLYIGFESKNEFNEFFEDYELWEGHVILEKTKYTLSVGDIGVEVYSDVETEELLYIGNNGYVVNSKDEVTREERYHQISNIVSLKELLKKFESEKRDDCQYRSYIMPIYQKVSELLNGKETISMRKLNRIFGNLNDIHSYVFRLIEEDEYEDLFGCKMYDFSTGSRVRK